MIPDLSGSLRLSAEGKWFHDDHEFTNEKLIDLFFRSIVWNEDRNGYILQVGKFSALFNCEDTPYFVLKLEGKDEEWKILLSDKTTENFIPSTLSFGGQNQAYCTVKGAHKARFTRGAHQTLLEHACSETTLKFGSQIVRVINEKR